MQKAFREYGVSDIRRPYMKAIRAGERVSHDIGREVTRLHEAEVALVGKVIPRAVSWVTREGAARQLAVQLEQHLAQFTKDTQRDAIEAPAPE